MRGSLHRRIFLVLSALSLCGLIDGSTRLAAGGLAFEERVAAHRALEEVRARHRMRPSDARSSVSESLLRDQVEDYLAKSVALETVWNRSVTREDLQLEIDRSARDTKDAARLRELFAALGNEPLLVAECLARPILVERTIRDLYAFDPELHASLRAEVEKVAEDPDPSTRMARSGGRYIEYDVLRDESGDAASSSHDPGYDRRVYVGAEEWRRRTERPDNVGVPVETAGYLQLEVVISRTEDRIRVARTRWPKRSFDSWWREEGPERDVPVRSIPTAASSSDPFVLPELAEADCTDNTWLPTSTGTDVPDPREDHTAVWTGSEMIVWGGRDPSPLGTGGAYEPATDSWRPTPTDGDAPSARFDHTAIWTGTEMIVWGGFGTAYENTGARYDPVLNSWTPTVIDATTPDPRVRHTVVWTGTEMIVWGGLDATGYVATGGVYDPSPTIEGWRLTSVTGDLPSGRAHHTAVWTGTEMIVWGGYDGIEEVDTGSRYDLATNAWTATPIGVDTPSARREHTAVWTGAEMIVWGGAGNLIVNSGGRYDPVTEGWFATPTAGVPPARIWHTAVWTDVEMIVWGGSIGNSTGGRYRPLTNGWTATSTGTDAPAGRNRHTAVWIGPTDTRMIVWGGVMGSTRTNTGGLYCAVCSDLAWHPDLDLDGFGDPSVTQTSCDEIPGFVLDDTDCDDADATVYPAAPQLCDGLNNDCADAGWPGLAGTNEFDNDGDTFSTCAGDCNDGDLTIWMVPDPARDLLFAADKQSLTWSSPSAPGGVTVAYDTLRADTPTSFDVAGTCVESDDDIDLTSIDATAPPASGVLHYLVRPQNGCGLGSIGTDSAGTPRIAVDCP